MDPHSRRSRLIPALAWGGGWAIATSVAVGTMYFHLRGGSWTFSTISVVVGGAAGFALGTFCAATIAMDSIGARASAGREAIGWALGYAIAALMFMWPADEGAGGRGRFVICVPLFGLLGGLFQAIGRAGPHFPKHATLTIVTMAAWALAVSVGAILSVHPIYLLLEIGSRTMEPVSEVTGAILGSGLGGLFGGTTAALLGWWLEPSWSHQ